MDAVANLESPDGHVVDEIVTSLRLFVEQHNYPAAREQYQLASAKHSDSGRIHRKLLVSTLNVGIGYIKSRDYPKALAWMEMALELDPDNPHAKKKAKQLRRVIEKTQRRMKQYLEEGLSGSKEKGT